MSSKPILLGDIIEQASLRHRRAMVLAFPRAVLGVLVVPGEP